MRPRARIEPDFDAPVDAEPLDLPASAQASDMLQSDLAQELIASLESDEDFSGLDDGVAAHEAAKAHEIDDMIPERGPVSAELDAGPAEQAGLPGHASASAHASLEDELEAILNPGSAMCRLACGRRRTTPGRRLWSQKRNRSGI